MSAIYAYHAASPPANAGEIAAMSARLASRGPDDAGSWTGEKGRLALGHRRLAIIDLDRRAAQPMVSACGRFVISFNGEIYNYRELRDEVFARGAEFRTASDTEALLELDAPDGKAALSRLRGMFAYVIGTSWTIRSCSPAIPAGSSRSTTRPTGGPCGPPPRSRPCSLAVVCPATRSPSPASRASAPCPPGRWCVLTLSAPASPTATSRSALFCARPRRPRPPAGRRTSGRRSGAPFSTEHTVRVVDQAEFAADFPCILDAMDQPTIDGLNTWFVSKAGRERGLKATLSGLGGDELFAGYPSFHDLSRWSRTLRCLSRLPLAGRAARAIVGRIGSARGWHPKLAGMGGTWPGDYVLRRGLFMPWKLETALDPEIDCAGALLQDGPTTPSARVALLESALYMRHSASA